MASQVYVWPWRLLWTAVNLLMWRTFNKSRYLLGSSFIRFLVCEWSDSYGIMLVVWAWAEGTKSLRYSPQDKTDSMEKNLHVPPRTVGITTDYVQYIIHMELYRVCWLLVFVHWAVWVKGWTIVTMLQAAKYGFWTPAETCDFSVLWNVQTGCGTTQPLIQRVRGFFPGGKVAGAWSWPFFSI